MKKITLILLMTTLLMITGCKDNKKDLYLPKAKNDKVYTTIGGEDKKKTQAETEFCLISENAFIELNSDMANISMVPINFEQGSGDGFKWTENKYADIQIKALLSNDDKWFINKIITNSSVYETARGICVGDSVSKLKDTYKDNLEYSESIEKSYYVYDPENDIGFKRIFFHVENDSINEIVIEDGIDG